MSLTTIYAIAVFLAGIIGYFIGLLAARQRAASAETETTPPPEPPAPAETIAPPPAPVESDEHVALQVSINKALQWKVQLDDLTLRPGETILSAEQRQRLVNILLQVRPWLESKSLAPEETAAPAVKPTSAAEQPLSAKPTPPVAPAPVRPTILGGLATAIEKEMLGKKAAPLPSIVEMIDAILQKNLAGTPLEARKIRLEEGQLGEVLVWVGIKKYALNDVPDDEVKAAIQQAIAEFNSPGKKA